MISREELKNLKVLVMGLGLNGGGLSSARFLAKEGAQVCVTDLRDEETLRPSIDQLEGLPIRYVLGKHEKEDFLNADMVIKNPAVPMDSPFLEGVKRIESDISLFLSFCHNPLIAVTGSKGKSTIVSALFHIMRSAYSGCRLGGNITISPLSFIDELQPDDPVILELSSWQLADLAGKGLLKPQIAMISNIMHDHQNRYKSFQDYIDDKLSIFLEQESHQQVLLPLEEKSRGWESLPGGKKDFFSFSPINYSPELRFGFQDGKGIFRNLQNKEEILIQGELHLPGNHIRGNLLAAGAIARLFGVDKSIVVDKIKDFPGVPHRMELCRNWKGISFYNDTAATLPDALVAALESFPEPPILIFGGTDKELDLSIMKGKLSLAKSRVLLYGSASQRMIPIMEQEGLNWEGPYPSMEEAFQKAIELAKEGDIILLSPGATSFGMFQNEFHRGNTFRQLVEGLN